jgi:hypothetical protein
MIINCPLTGKRRSSRAKFRDAACLSLLLVTLITGCSALRGDDFAVDKVSKEQLQATPYVVLNADKPGMQIDPRQYLVPGRYTIVVYYSPYDQTSANLQPRLAQLVQVRQDLAVRMVNVNRAEAQGVDWQSPVVLNEGIQELPYIQIYEPNMRLRAHGRPAYEQVVQWVQ